MVHAYELYNVICLLGDDSSVGNSDTPETDEDGVHSCFKETEV